ncbi:hypothetical protein BGX20_005645 [Mortierella sp. AD010]|nr:hypothetical protein BGX20_005645 [Mortierella sp. AD010]
MTLDFESSLHSFVLDQTESLVNLFEGRDWEQLKTALDQTDSNEEIPLLQEWKGREIIRYSKDLHGVEEVIWSSPEQDAVTCGLDQAELRRFRKRLRSVMLKLSIIYEDYNNALSESQSETWYLK